MAKDIGLVSVIIGVIILRYVSKKMEKVIQPFLNIAYLVSVIYTVYYLMTL